jgi:hypothetical protein
MKNIDSMVKNKGFSCKFFTRANLMDLFLIIANSKESKADTFSMFEDFRLYQSNLGGLHYSRPELNFLNKFIMTKHYTISYFISKVYALLYGNDFIRKVYRFRNNTSKKFIKEFYEN